MKASDLQQFCAADKTRTSIATPYVRKGRTYATDGHLAVRIPGEAEGVRIADDGPDADAVIDPCRDDGTWMPLALPDGVGEPVKCPHCGMVLDITPVAFGSHHYHAYRLRRLLSLPGIELCDVPGHQPQRLRFAGGDGAIMPIEEEDAP